MGPFDEDVQARRARAIQSVLSNPKLSKQARAIWTTHLRNLAVTESEYNKRVKEVYSNHNTMLVSRA